MAPTIANRKPRIWIHDGAFQVRNASTIIRNTLLSIMITESGAAGPLVKAVYVSDFPSVSKTLPPIPIRKRYPLNRLTFYQYQQIPKIRTKKLVTDDDPKLAVFASNLYLSDDMNFENMVFLSAYSYQELLPQTKLFRTK